MNDAVQRFSAFALATALLSTSSCTAPPRADASKARPAVQETVAFHVIGLMKTKSGAT